ncbi:hypothetical protein ASF33_09995 [Methylobacterium sp. Leaf92]|nr:hypothetical protein ASF33_09995 [Methylobacterium sp. Leaf92]
MPSAKQEAEMTIRCEAWLNEKQRVGEFEFASVPRVGETISVPAQKDEEYVHYRVEDVTHRAAGQEHPSTTYLFVAKAE